MVHRGETLSIKCTIFNWQEYDEEVVIILHGSDDFDFVHVEEYGYVASFAPRRSSGDHQYMIFNSGRYPFQITCFYSRLEGIPSRLEWIHSGHVPEFGYENSPQNSGVKYATLP